MNAGELGLDRSSGCAESRLLMSSHKQDSPSHSTMMKSINIEPMEVWCTTFLMLSPQCNNAALRKASF
jgi:hypothetical protein